MRLVELLFVIEKDAHIVITDGKETLFEGKVEVFLIKGNSDLYQRDIYQVVAMSQNKMSIELYYSHDR